MGRRVGGTLPAEKEREPAAVDTAAADTAATATAAAAAATPAKPAKSRRHAGVRSGAEAAEGRARRRLAFSLRAQQGFFVLQVRPR